MSKSYAIMAVVAKNAKNTKTWRYCGISREKMRSKTIKRKMSENRIPENGQRKNLLKKMGKSTMKKVSEIRTADI